MASVAGGSASANFRATRRRRRCRVAFGLVALAAAAWAVVAALPAVVALGLGAGGAAALVAGLLGPSVRDADRWWRGAEGERRTAEVLDALPARRWAVWHDLAVPGSRSNIDHLVIGRTGIWVVDTKTTRARIRSGWRSVSFGDRRLDSSATRWEADVVADRLGAMVGDRLRHPIRVRPLIAVHGDGLRARGGRCGGVRVVPVAGLLPRLRRGRRHLSRRERRLVCEAVQVGLAGSGNGAR